ncbi:unnamed protein product [Litomosoides sigmodontis]|uniref:RING-type domain-containing protein n=1 Tax=Litomosoides sigmodontis TaxID=42156 RepID=A0A3P6VAI0_LITSI|nr:unnamed protein product [Litomosoides sigmodontis]
MADGPTNSNAPDVQDSNAKRLFVCCAICKERVSSDEFAALPCGHLFHFMCIMYFFICDWSSCPECRKPSDIGDIMPLLNFADNAVNISDAEKKLMNYRDALRKLHKAHVDNFNLEKKELESAVENLNLKKENYELKRKYLELTRENKVLKGLLMMKP